MAEFNGTSGPDEIDGSEEGDVINGLGGHDKLYGSRASYVDSGNDTINGGDGNDEIYGYDGSDTLNGDAGDDTIEGDDGSDFIYGGSGRDELVGGNDHDFIDGGEGDDDINGGNDNDEIYGGLGNDTINGGSGTDTIYGGEGNDTVDGGRQNDTIYGGAGDDTLIDDNGVDTIYGGEGNDTIDGGTDDDFLYGDAGNDTINGENGNDTITAGVGNDTIDGGDGADKLIYDFNLSSIQQLKRNYENVLTLTSAAGVDKISNVETFQFLDQTISTENLTSLFSEIDNETIIGTPGIDVINGGAGNDIIYGDSGGDAILGGAGNDIIYGGEGNDVVDGGDGNDTVVFHYARSDVTIIESPGVSIISVGSAPVGTVYNVEKMIFSDSSEYVPVENFIDLTKNSTSPTRDFKFTKLGLDGNAIEVTPTVYSGAVSYLEYELLGENTRDVITGSAFNDFMNLLGGDDAANGGDGDDVLDGGTGSNFLTGGNGNDTIFLDGRGGSITWSTVTDFTSGDSVNIWGWIDTTSKLLLTQESGGVGDFTGATFHYDLNNDGSIDTSITLSGLSLSEVPVASAQSVADTGYLLIA